MTAPEENPPADEDRTESAGNTGTLAAATQDNDPSDPLGPLNRVTEDGDDS